MSSYPQHEDNLSLRRRTSLIGLHMESTLIWESWIWKAADGTWLRSVPNLGWLRITILKFNRALRNASFYDQAHTKCQWSRKLVEHSLNTPFYQYGFWPSVSVQNFRISMGILVSPIHVSTRLIRMRITT